MRIVRGDLEMKSWLLGLWIDPGDEMGRKYKYFGEVHSFFH